MTQRDIEGALSAAARPTTLTATASASAPRTTPLSATRRTIARRLGEAKPGVPHFYLERDVDATGLRELRAQLNRDVGDARVSYNDLVLRACALALRAQPALNVSLVGENVVQHDRVDIGVAVALGEGLVTPVVRDADHKDVLAIARETRDLVDRARVRRLRPEEMHGATFTISNLGMYGIERFAAIINPPETAILAVGTVLTKPVVQGAAVVPGWRLSLTLSCDHRVVDGHVGAVFLAALADLIEHPLRLMVGKSEE